MCEGHYTYLHALHFKMLSHLRHDYRQVNLPNFLFNTVKKQASLVQLGKDQSVSHHCLIKLIIESELNKQEIGTWEKFLWLKEVEPRLVGPRGQGVGCRERTSTGFCKVVPKAKNFPEASPSSSRLTKKRIYKVEPSIASKKKSKNVEVASALETPSSTKNRSTIDKG